MSVFSDFDKKTEEYRKLEQQFLRDLIDIIKDKRFDDEKGVKPIGTSGVCFSVPFSALASAGTWSIKSLISEFQTKAIVSALEKKETAPAAKNYIKKVLTDGYVVASDREKVKLNNRVKEFLVELIGEEE